MHTNFESFKYCFIGKTGEGLTGSYERAMEHSHVHQYVLALSYMFSPSFNGGLGNDVFWRLPWGHSQRTCDLILASRAFCTSSTLCACLRMVAGAEARAGKVLVIHTHRLRCGGGVAEGTERELYPGTVHLVTLEVASYRLPDFLQKELSSSSFTAINLPNTVLNQSYLAIIATCCIL